ncbi:hypothetical protein FHT02_004340 [Sphingomonas xinjiangensis]|uniref:Uncharacterized protein n=1 Tax=Sphingomonas xinjiangensis TaxID=643568 RepID=A0A840YTT8_9SPHN|nr:hypothetical protein [Sphingomonas xinjiangensis]
MPVGCPELPQDRGTRDGFEVLIYRWKSNRPRNIHIVPVAISALGGI